jgi:cyclase
MLKRRVIITLQLNDGVLFRTKCFRPDLRYTQSFLGSENADEVTILDITRHGNNIPPLEGRKSFVDAAMGYARFCYTPLTIGGGIRTMDDVHFALTEIGADKVLINTAAFHDNTLTLKLAEKFGSQAVVVGIDAGTPEKGHNVITNQGTLHHCTHAVSRAIDAVYQGAGEIYLTSVDRDGSLRGFDLELLRKVYDQISVPIVIAGGCGGYHHMAEAFDAGADGAATSNIFHLTDTSLKNFKVQLVKQGKPVRP